MRKGLLGKSCAAAGSPVNRAEVAITMWRRVRREVMGWLSVKNCYQSKHSKGLAQLAFTRQCLLGHGCGALAESLFRKSQESS